MLVAEWDAADLAASERHGGDVEVLLIGHSTGAATVEVGAVGWDVFYGERPGAGPRAD